MIRFSKYTGAGNDFVIVEPDRSPVSDPEALARRICPRSTGVGVDGLVLVRPVDAGLVRIRFFNPDGSEFSTCGNGTRCAARYTVDAGLVEGPEFALRTDAGDVEARVEGERVVLRYSLDARVERELEVDAGGTRAGGWLVQIGTPHFVVPLGTLPEEGFEDAARPLRHHPDFPEGANVDFVAPREGGGFAIRTFERGVEGETRACGSGAMAAALVLHRLGRAGRSVALRTRDGALLGIELPDRDGDGILLSGPARRLFRGDFPETG